VKTADFASGDANRRNHHFSARATRSRSMDRQLSQEFDQGVAEDEIVAGAGHYSLGTVPGTTWKALVIIGAVTTLWGIVLELMTRGWILPVADYFPTPLGSGLVLSVLVAGLLILAVGFGVRRHGAREPPLEPIV